jgi:glyoxylase-like metal-dependent hydrolase (beta-lactamase superfamily II)
MNRSSNFAVVSAPLNRRSFLALAGAAVAGACTRVTWAKPAHAPSAFMQQQLDMAAKAQLSGKMLRGDVGVIIGAGGNVGVLKGADGAVLVDSSYSTAAEHLWEQVNALGIQKVPLLINTHWHFDHTDGNAALHARGARILAHAQTRHWMSQDHEINVPGLFDHAVIEAAPKAGLPDDVMTSERTLKHGGETMRLKHYPAAHTDSDIAIFFEKANVVHTGDLYFSTSYPMIDFTTGGRISGMIDAGHKILAATNEETIIIPGHGPIATRQQYADYVTMMETIEKTVQMLKQQGKSVDEVVAAKATAAFDDQWGKGFIKPDGFARLVYLSM